MEVILRKSKLTASILNQILFATLDQMLTYQVLGWVVFKGYMWIILYDSKSHNLAHIYLNSTFELSERWDSSHTIIKYGIKFYHQRQTTVEFQLEDRKSTTDKLRTLKLLKTIAQDKGQIFY